MDATAVNRTLSAPFVGASEPPPHLAAENRSIIQAVKALNAKEMFGHDNQLTFQRDPETKRMVIQMINPRTHEVVVQIPAEYGLRLAEDLKQPEVSASPGRVG